MPQEMIYLPLPDGNKMPSVGLGTWESCNESELEAALNRALEIGYRHIDTAFVYENEAMIGRILKKWFDSEKIKREDLFIVTKLPFFGMKPEQVEVFLKKSLENLQLDYVDLFLIHFPVGFQFDASTGKPKRDESGQLDVEGPTDHVGIWKKMEEQVDVGRTKYIGLSNYTVEQIQKILAAARIKPANLQIEIHLYFPQNELVDFCQKDGITVTAYSPLGCPGFNKFLKKIGRNAKELPNVLGNELVTKIAQKYSKTPAQVALRFLIQRGLNIIPKSVNPKRVEENFDLFGFNLDEMEMGELHKLDLGENARVCDFKTFPKAREHPDFPVKL